MKLSVMQENLARGLQVVSRAVSSRSTLPVLANVLLRTEDAGLKLTATNLEIGITAWVPGKIDSEGALTVPARLFTDLVAGLPAGERVDLEADGDTRCASSAGRYQTHLRGIDAEEFPVIPSPGERPTTRVSQKELKRALSEVVFAAATDEARPILTGVLTRFSGDRLTLAAADNYRIAVRSLPILDPVEDTSLVVPARSYAELMRVLTDTDDPVEIMLASSKSQILFHVEGVDLVSRLIDGQFPNYQQVLPTQPLDARRGRARRAAQGGPHLGVDRQLGGQRGAHAPGRRRHGHDHDCRRGRRRRGADRGRGGDRGRHRADRVQRALPAGRAPEPRPGPAGARVLGPAVARRASGRRRRRGLRPRDHARPNAVLTGGLREVPGSAGSNSASVVPCHWRQ